MGFKVSGSFGNIFEDLKVPITCPNCSEQTKQSLAWLQANDKMTCGCGAVIVFNKDNFTGPVGDAQNALDQFQKTLNDLNDD